MGRQLTPDQVEMMTTVTVTAMTMTAMSTTQIRHRFVNQLPVKFVRDVRCNSLQNQQLLCEMCVRMRSMVLDLDNYMRSPHIIAFGVVSGSGVRVTRGEFVRHDSVVSEMWCWWWWRCWWWWQ